MKNKKTAALLDRIRDASQGARSHQKALADHLEREDYSFPNRGNQVRAYALQLQSYQDELSSLVDAAKTIGIPSEDIKVACGEDRDAFYDLFDAYRAAEKEKV